MRALKNLARYVGDEYKCVGETSTFDQTFNIVGREELLRGVYYAESERSIVHLHRHEAIEDIYNTCVHETIHHCIFKIIDEKDEGMGSLMLDIEQEHDIIRNMAWADFWSVDDYSQINGEMVKTSMTSEEEKKLYDKYNKSFKESDWL